MKRLFPIWTLGFWMVFLSESFGDAPLTGKLVKPDGSPASGVRIRTVGWHWSPEYESAEMRETSTDATGRFTIKAPGYAFNLKADAILEGDTVLCTTFPDLKKRLKPRNASWGGAPGAVTGYYAKGEPVELGSFTLEKSGTFVSGTLSRDGKPLAGADLAVGKAGLPFSLFRNVGNARMDGAFGFGLPPGKGHLLLVVRAPEGNVVGVEDLGGKVGGGARVNLELKAWVFGKITGKITLDGTSVGGVDLFTFRKGSSKTYVEIEPGVSGRRGDYTLLLPVGAWEVWACSDDIPPRKVAEIESRAGETRAQDLSLSTTGTGGCTVSLKGLRCCGQAGTRLKGREEIVKGKGLGVFLILRRAQSSSAPAGLHPLRCHRIKFLGHSNPLPTARFDFKNLPAGRWIAEVWIGRAQYPRGPVTGVLHWGASGLGDPDIVSRAPVEITPGRTAEVEVVFPRVCGR
ncbi:MAG: transthyretin-like family protein [Planctomycetota bacterium]|jgi:hypothetical protein